MASRFASWPRYERVSVSGRTPSVERRSQGALTDFAKTGVTVEIEERKPAPMLKGWECSSSLMESDYEQGRENDNSL